MRSATGILAGVSLLSLAACAAGGGWINPDVPSDRWGADLSACRRLADRELGPAAYVEPGDERSSDPMKMVDRGRTRKQFDAIVALCMSDKGYRQK